MVLLVNQKSNVETRVRTSYLNRPSSVSDRDYRGSSKYNILPVRDWSGKVGKRSLSLGQEKRVQPITNKLNIIPYNSRTRKGHPFEKTSPVPEPVPNTKLRVTPIQEGKINGSIWSENIFTLLMSDLSEILTPFHPKPKLREDRERRDWNGYTEDEMEISGDESDKQLVWKYCTTEVLISGDKKVFNKIIP